MPHKLLDRRSFHGQAAAGALAALAMANRSARAADANETLVAAVMGVNGRGQALAKAFGEQKGLEVACVCDVDSLVGGKFAAGLVSATGKTPRFETDIRRVLEDRAIDLLIVAAPDHWHAPATIMACAAGKHVYVEKPACHNGNEGELMVAAARKHRRIVQMGSQRRSSPGHLEAIGRVRSGELGRVLFARGWINSVRPTIGQGKVASPPAHLDYALWQGPAPERPYRDNVIHYHWHWFWDWGTGELGNNGIHALDVCRWGLGVDYPDKIVCGGGRYHFHDDQETPDTQLATFHFSGPNAGDGYPGGKAIAWEHRTWSKRGFEGDSFGIVFYGEKGSLVVTHSDYRVFDMEGKELDKRSAAYSDALHIGNFLASIRGEQTPNAEIEEGVKSTALCHLGNIAYRTGRTVTFDPQARRVMGDDEAAALWSREYRPGWAPSV